MKRLYTYNSKNFPHIDREEYEVTSVSAVFQLGYIRRCFLGRSVEIWDSPSGGKKYSLGIDYVITQDAFDIANSKLVGESCYSGIKFIKQTGKIYVSYDVVASYSSGQLINEHEARLDGQDARLTAHDSRIDSIEVKNTNQDSAITQINNTLDNHSARILSLEQFKVDPYTAQTLADMYAITDCTVGDICYVSETALFYSFSGEEWVVMSGSGGSGGETLDAIVTNIDVDYVTPILTQNTKLYFSPSQDRACNITAGAVSVGTKLFLYHSGSGNFKETVTYATGKTYVMTRKMFAELESVPGGWMFVRESRIGHMDSGMFVPRGAVTLNGDLRDKDALWHYITEYLSVYIVTETAWQAGDCLKFVNYSETQYRIADWRGITTRFSGVNSVLKKADGTAYDGGGISSVLLDAMQKITGAIAGVVRHGTGSSSSGAITFTKVDEVRPNNGGQDGRYNITFDSSNSPNSRTSAENRSVSGSEIKYIFVED